MLFYRRFKILKKSLKAIETLPLSCPMSIVVTAVDRRNNDQSLLEIVLPLDAFISRLVENVRRLVRVQKKNIGEKCTFDARHVISECLVNNANNAITKSDGGGGGNARCTSTL